MKTNQDHDLSRILESAVVASWADLIRDAQTGLVHVEYGFAPSGTRIFFRFGRRQPEVVGFRVVRTGCLLQHFTEPAFTLKMEINQRVSHTSWNR